jgi:hypothetical protein
MNTRLLKKQTNIAEKVGISKLEFKYPDEKNGAVNRGMNGVNNGAIHRVMDGINKGTIDGAEQRRDAMHCVSTMNKICLLPNLPGYS